MSNFPATHIEILTMYMTCMNDSFPSSRDSCSENYNLLVYSIQIYPLLNFSEVKHRIVFLRLTFLKMNVVIFSVKTIRSAWESVSCVLLSIFFSVPAHADTDVRLRFMHSKDTGVAGVATRGIEVCCLIMSLRKKRSKT